MVKNNVNGIRELKVTTATISPSSPHGGANGHSVQRPKEREHARLGNLGRELVGRRPARLVVSASHNLPASLIPCRRLEHPT